VVVLVTITILLWLASLSGERRTDIGDVLEMAERLSTTAALQYSSGSFSAATSALMKEIHYLQVHRDDLTRSLRIDKMLRISHARLMTLFLHVGDLENANRHLTECYTLFVRDSATHPVQSMSKRAFLDLSMEWIETIDARTGAKWKSDVLLDPGMVEALRVRLAEQE
jgi:transcriptional antiterminator Rof (Rho-off)